MNKSIIAVIIVVVVIIGGYFVLNNLNPTQPDNNSNSLLPSQEENQNSPTPSVEEQNGVMEATASTNDHVINYTDSGYSPNTLTIKVGDSVTFKNNSSKSMWPASAMHPTHTVYSGTSLVQHCPDEEKVAFDACQGIEPGDSWTFTFKKDGNWKYHDHIAPSFFGSITVEQ